MAISKSEFIKRFDRYKETDSTIDSLLLDATGIVRTFIGRKYPSWDNLPTATLSIIERCVYDMTNILYLRKNGSNLNDNGLHLLYKEIVDIMNNLNNSVIENVVPESATPTCIVVSQTSNYQEEWLYD